jgi:hypothetical protein
LQGHILSTSGDALNITNHEKITTIAEAKNLLRQGRDLSILGSADGIQDGDNGWDVHSSPEWQVHFWHQDCGRDDDAIEHECNNMCKYLANKEECI